jgi:hypothetical protein
MARWRRREFLVAAIAAGEPLARRAAAQGAPQSVLARADRVIE